MMAWLHDAMQASNIQVVVGLISVVVGLNHQAQKTPHCAGLFGVVGLLLTQFIHQFRQLFWRQSGDGFRSLC